MALLLPLILLHQRSSICRIVRSPINHILDYTVEWFLVTFRYFLSAGAVQWQHCYIANILVLCAAPKLISVLVLFVTSEVYSFSLLLYREAFIGFFCYSSAAFPVAFISLCSNCCNILTGNDSEVVGYGHEQTFLWLSLFVLFSSNQRCFG